MPIKRFFDASRSANEKTIVTLITSKWPDSKKVNVDVADDADFISSSTQTPVLFVHRGIWQVAEQISKTFLSKLSDNNGLLVVFTGAFDGEYEDPDAWIKKYCQNFPPERVWVLLDVELVDIFETMADYLESTAPSEYKLEDFFVRTVPPAIVTLLILCQGYLAVRTPETVGLDASFMKQYDTGGADSRVTTPGWWMEAFGHRAEFMCNTLLAAAVDGIKSELNKEWRGPNAKLTPVLGLLDAISSGKISDEAVCSVWRAFNPDAPKTGTA